MEQSDPFDSRSKKLIWDRPSTHGMCSPCGRFLVCDINPYQWNDRKPCQVFFKDTETGQEIPLISHMPPHHVPWGDVRRYHIDPHPHFSADGHYVIFTSSVLGAPTVTLTAVQDILAAWTVTEWLLGSWDLSKTTSALA